MLLSDEVKLGIGAVAAVALMTAVAWYGEWRADAVATAVEQRYEQQILTQKVAAAKRLAEEVSKNNRLEETLRVRQAQIEENGRERKAITEDYRKRFDMLAAGGRLRDPNARCGCGGGGAAGPAAAGAGDGAAGRAEAGGLLSAELTGVLLRLQREADAVNDAYAVCRPALILRELTPSP